MAGDSEGEVLLEGELSRDEESGEPEHADSRAPVVVGTSVDTPDFPVEIRYGDFGLVLSPALQMRMEIDRRNCNDKCMITTIPCSPSVRKILTMFLLDYKGSAPLTEVIQSHLSQLASWLRTTSPPRHTWVGNLDGLSIHLFLPSS